MNTIEQGAHWLSSVNRTHRARPAARLSGAAENSQIEEPQGEVRASILQLSLFAEHGVRPDSNGVIHLEDIVAARDRLAKELDESLVLAFSAAGIDTSREIRFRSDSEGNVRVVGNHPQKGLIESVFAENPELTNKYHAISNMTALERIGIMHNRYAEAYAKDPQAAEALRQQIEYVTKYTVFTGSFGPDGFDYGFA